MQRAVKEMTPENPFLSGLGAVPSCSSWPAKCKRTLMRCSSSTGRPAALMKCLVMVVSSSQIQLLQHNSQIPDDAVLYPYCADDQ